MSGHKLYAPYGAGALIGERDWLSAGDPFLRGGGAVKLVTIDETLWAELPIARRPARRTSSARWRWALPATPWRPRAWTASPTRSATSPPMPGSSSVRSTASSTIVWDADHPRTALLTFNLAGTPYDLLAAVLSAEHGIGIRHGCFCAHPLMFASCASTTTRWAASQEVTRAGHHPNLPGAARMSLGLGSTRADIDAMADALRAIAAHGPR